MLRESPLLLVRKLSVAPEICAQPHRKATFSLTQRAEKHTISPSWLAIPLPTLGTAGRASGTPPTAKLLPGIYPSGRITPQLPNGVTWPTL